MRYFDAWVVPTAVLLWVGFIALMTHGECIGAWLYGVLHP